MNRIKMRLRTMCARVAGPSAPPKGWRAVLPVFLACSLAAPIARAQTVQLAHPTPTFQIQANTLRIASNVQSAFAIGPTGTQELPTATGLVAFPSGVQFLALRGPGAPSAIEYSSVASGLGFMPTDRFRVIRLPEMYVADPGNAQRRRRLEPVLLEHFVRLQESGLWEGSIDIFLRDLDNSGIVTVNPPLRFIANAVGGTASPQSVLVDTVFKTELVTLTLANPEDSVEVRVDSQLGGTYTSYVPVEPSLVFGNVRSSIQGFGVQTTDISLMIRGSTAVGDVPVTVSASPGSIEQDNPVMVSPRRATIVRLRSEGTGQARLEATAPDLVTAEATILYTVPWGFLIWSILGGLLGGLARYYFPRKGDPKSTVGRAVVRGLVAGFLVAAFWAVGVVGLLGEFVGLPDIKMFSEIVTLVVAAYGAWWWSGGKKDEGG